MDGDGNEDVDRNRYSVLPLSCGGWVTFLYEGSWRPGGTFPDFRPGKAPRLPTQRGRYRAASLLRDVHTVPSPEAFQRPQVLVT